MDIKERPILDLSQQRPIFNKQPTNKDTYMNVEGTTIWIQEVESRLERRPRKCREHIFETRMPTWT